MATILAVDDDPSALESFRMIFKGAHRILTATGAEEAMRLMQENRVNLVLLDLRMPGMNGLELLEHWRRNGNTASVVVVTAIRELDTVRKAMQLGACDYLTKPFDVEEIRIVVEKSLQTNRLTAEVRLLRKQVNTVKEVWDLVGSSEVMKATLSEIARVAETSTTVLIAGESGTGKELAARAIHKRSPRAEMPFVPVHCPSIPENLLESELFGFEKGAFTGADKRRTGCFEFADGGTVFLDEIGDMSLAMQTKLLRVIEEREVTRIGANRPTRIDVRIVTATNRDLRRAVEQNTFREDLFFRLNVVPITMPPLRERTGDVPLLASHFLRLLAKELHARAKSISTDAMIILESHSWPGNVRELRNVIERAVTLYRDKEALLPSHLPIELRNDRVIGNPGESLLCRGVSLKSAVQDLEREMILAALKRANGIHTKAARLLGVTRRVLEYKLERWSIDRTWSGKELSTREEDLTRNR